MNPKQTKKAFFSLILIVFGLSLFFWLRRNNIFTRTTLILSICIVIAGMAVLFVPVKYRPSVSKELDKKFHPEKYKWQEGSDQTKLSKKYRKYKKKFLENYRKYIDLVDLYIHMSDELINKLNEIISIDDSYYEGREIYFDWPKYINIFNKIMTIEKNMDKIMRKWTSELNKFNEERVIRDLNNFSEYYMRRITKTMEVAAKKEEAGI